MFKNVCTLLILFSTITIYSQNFTLLKNYNPKAQELNHSLNNTRDSLILGSKNTIYKVEIFNEDFEKMIVVEDVKVKISLNDLPVGKFVVEAKLSDKIIIMDLIRHNYNEISNSTLSPNKKEAIEGKGMMLDEQLNVIKSSPTNSIEYMLTHGKAKKRTYKNQKFYWVVSKIDNGDRSSKAMKLVDQESVDRMIKKNKLEYKSTTGKLNELTVWEVYNTSKFMRNQMSNPDFVYSSTSDFFNVKPYYSRENSLQTP